MHTSSNHRLESAGLNALEGLLFKMLGMSGEDSNVCLVCKGNWIGCSENAECGVRSAECGVRSAESKQKLKEKKKEI